MKTVLLIVHDDPAMEARLQAALDVTRGLGGHLTCLNVEFPTIPYPAIAFPAGSIPAGRVPYGDFAGSTSGELASRVQAPGQAHTHDFKASLLARLAREDVAWDWLDGASLPQFDVEDAAMLADLVVLSDHFGQGQISQITRLVVRAVKKTGRPVLAVPQSTRRFDLDGTVLIAWDGSREASQALHDAVPLLKMAKDVILFEMNARDGVLEPVPAAAYLSRNDIHVQTETRQRPPGELGYQCILDKAHEARASYIVMGAFGRLPAVEAVLGGVTRSMLAHCDLPLLLAH